MPHNQKTVHVETSQSCVLFQCLTECSDTTIIIKTVVCAFISDKDRTHFTVWDWQTFQIEFKQSFVFSKSLWKSFESWISNGVSCFSVSTLKIHSGIISRSCPNFRGSESEGLNCFPRPCGILQRQDFLLDYLMFHFQHEDNKKQLRQEENKQYILSSVRFVFFFKASQITVAPLLPPSQSLNEKEHDDDYLTSESN